MFKYGVIIGDSLVFAFNGYLLDNCPKIELDHSLDLVSIFIISGIEQRSNQNKLAAVYPSVTSVTIYLEGVSSSDIVLLMDLTGKYAHLKPNSEIDLSGFVNGLYQIQIISKENKLKLNQKILKF